MNRSGVKMRLVEVLQHALPDVHVAYTWAGDTATDSTLWLGEAIGALDPETVGHEHLVVDEWTIRSAIELHGFDTAAEAERRVNDALTAIDQALRSARRLRLAGVLDDGDLATYRDVRDVRLTQVDGPFHSNPGLTGGDLIVGFAQFDLLCTADL